MSNESAFPQGQGFAAITSCTRAGNVADDRAGLEMLRLDDRMDGTGHSENQISRVNGAEVGAGDHIRAAPAAKRALERARPPGREPRPGDSGAEACRRARGACPSRGTVEAGPAPARRAEDGVAPRPAAAPTAYPANGPLPLPAIMGRFDSLATAHGWQEETIYAYPGTCLLYTSPSLRDRTRSRMPSSA